MDFEEELTGADQLVDDRKWQQLYNWTAQKVAEV